jgi:hypothetical protein
MSGSEVQHIKEIFYKQFNAADSNPFFLFICNFDGYNSSKKETIMSPGYQGPLEDIEPKKENHLNNDYDPGNISDNSLLRKEIILMLKKRPEVNSSRVSVKANGSIAQLSGKVDGPVAKATIEGIVRSLDGVSEVVSSLEIDDEILSGTQGILIK